MIIMFNFALTNVPEPRFGYLHSLVGHRVLGAYIDNEEQLQLLLELMHSEQAMIIMLDMWSIPRNTGSNVTMSMSGWQYAAVEPQFQQVSLRHWVLTANLQDWIDQERRENEPGELLTERRGEPAFAVDVYHPLEEINAYLDDLPNNYPDLVRVKNIGTTYEENRIRLVMVSRDGEESRKPVVWIDAGIHSREWIAPATALYILQHLLDTADNSTLLDTYDFHIVPVLNPDGYVYTWTWNRLWRKNRAPSRRGVFCRGTDPNRNFDAQFGGASTSTTPCSQIFKGDSAFSEAESVAVRDGVLSLGSRLKAYFSLHSFSQIWMCPHGYRWSEPSDIDHLVGPSSAHSQFMGPPSPLICLLNKTPTRHSIHSLLLMEVLDKAVSAVKERHGTDYKYGPTSSTLYFVSGTSSDWVYDVAGVRYSYAVELRDMGQFGFILPKSHILPCGEETLAGLEAALLHIGHKHGYLRHR
ncbi:CPO [Cordylochernes scorpioides]|uniref:CPO n=1 Tax=Cordylochernes scorpioides TaxID=51811 RepID=A0ABY6L7V1_9ARAC|nr:CPO [Cordylochernes scorpioides]